MSPSANFSRARIDRDQVIGHVPLVVSATFNVEQPVSAARIPHLQLNLYNQMQAASCTTTLRLCKMPPFLPIWVAVLLNLPKPRVPQRCMARFHSELEIGNVVQRDVVITTLPRMFLVSVVEQVGSRQH